MQHIAVTGANRVAIGCTFFPLWDASGAVAYVAVAFKDVTAEFIARENAESELVRLQAIVDEKDRLTTALRDSEERLRSTLEAAELGTWEWNVALDSVQWSPNIERIFRLAPGTFGGTYQAWLALVHPEDRDSMAAAIATALRTLAPYEAEFRFMRGDGSTGWQSTRAHVIADPEGRPLLVRGVVFDVTARRAAEDALKMPAQVLENMAEGVSLTDEHGVILYTNPAEDRMFGYERSELRGQHVTVQNAYPPEENERIVAQVIAQLRAKGEWMGEWSNRRKDGSTFTTRSRITTLELDGKSHWLCVQDDVSEYVVARERAQRLADSLRDSEARYRSFVGQSTEGIWRVELEQPIAVDSPANEQLEHFYRHGYLAECNDAMARMYGYERASDLVGARLADLLVRDDPRNTDYLLEFITSGYRLERAESHEVDREGQPRVFQNSLVGTIDHGTMSRAWGTQRDVTPEIEARQQAEAANQAKDEFLALLGHELRNPLAPILTALELMKLRDSGAFPRERAIVERQVKHVVRLVDDLLDVSRITRGKISLEQQRVELVDVIASALELTSSLFEQRAHRLTVDVPRGLFVRGDPMRLLQVFTNLLTNAAKYTPPSGGIVIAAERVDGQLRVLVRDTGIGIRAEILPKIFDLFVQERQALDRSEGGLGLGLAIVRSLVELHGGRVTVRSEGVGHGSEFCVVLPAAPDPPVSASARSGRAPIARPDGWKALVVDDNQDAAELLANLLGEWGHVVRVAHTGPAALALIEQFTPDLALLDIGLPGMDGYELARQLRARAALVNLRLVAVTGYGQAKDRIAAEQAGFAAHLVKPVDSALLETVLARVMAAN
jgi:PAS domain S-box-containing protein